MGMDLSITVPVPELPKVIPAQPCIRGTKELPMSSTDYTFDQHLIVMSDFTCVRQKNTDPINAPTSHVTVLVFVLVYLFTHDSIKPTSTLTLGSIQSPPASLYVPLNGCPHLIQSLGRIKTSEDGIISTAAQHHHALLGLLDLSRLC